MGLSTGILAALSLLALTSFAAAAAPVADQYWVYIGTFTSGSGQGIYASKLDVKAGTLSPAQRVSDTVEPNYLTLHPTLPVLYAVAGSPPPEKKQAGVAEAYAINAETGALSLMNRVPTNGRDAVYIAVNKPGALAVAAHYSSATVVSIKLNHDGRLAALTSQPEQTGSGINPRRQQHSYPHSICFDPAGTFAFSPDLGADKVFVYSVEAGALKSNDPPAVSVKPGSGPRHMVFDAAGAHAYLVNELSNTVDVFNYDSRSGTLTPVQTLTTLPPDFTGSNTGADIRLHPGGKFLYASNRGHESLAVFTVNAADGTLTPAGHYPVEVKMPRGFAIDPTGHYLIAAGQQSGTLALFAINQTTGALTLKGEIAAPKPVCVVFFPAK